MNIKFEMTPVRWVLLTLFLLTLLGSVPAVSQALMYDVEGLAAGQWWRPITAWISQLNYKHWLLNQWGIVMMAVLLPSKIKPIELTGFVFVWLASSVLLWQSDYDNYVGLSGLLYGWLVLAAYLTPFYAAWVKAVFIGFLSFKVLSENGILPLPDSGWVGDFIGAQVAYLSHLWGLTTGFLAMISLMIVRRFP